MESGSAWESNPPAARFTYRTAVLKTEATTRCARTSERNYYYYASELQIQTRCPRLRFTSRIVLSQPTRGRLLFLGDARSPLAAPQ